MDKKRKCNWTLRAKKLSNSLCQFYFLTFGGNKEKPLVYRFSAKVWCNIFRAIGFDVCPSDIGHYADNGMVFRHIGYFLRVSDTDYIDNTCYVRHYDEYFKGLEKYMFYKNFDGEECRLYVGDLYAILFCLQWGYIEITLKRRKLSKRGKSTKRYYFRYANDFHLCNEHVQDMVKKSGLVKSESSL